MAKEKDDGNANDNVSTGNVDNNVEAAAAAAAAEEMGKIDVVADASAITDATLPAQHTNESGNLAENWWDDAQGATSCAESTDVSNFSFEQCGALSHLLDQSLFRNGEFDAICTQEQQWQQYAQAPQEHLYQHRNTTPLVPMRRSSSSSRPSSSRDPNLSTTSTTSTTTTATSSTQFALLRDRMRGSNLSSLDNLHVSNEEAADPSSSETYLAGTVVTRYNVCAKDGVTLFFAGVGHSLPLYANEQDFYQRLEACDAQIFPVAALGYALYEGHASSSCTMMRQKSADVACSRHFLDALHTSDDLSCVTHHVAFLVMLGYIAYSARDNRALKQHLRLACSSAVRVGLHRIDDRRDVETNKKDALRRVWWELWVLDAIMDVVSSGSVMRALGDVHAGVKFPVENRVGSGDGDTCDADSLFTKVYSLRVRAVALLIDSVTALKKAPTAVTVKRLGAADIIQANAIAEAQQLSAVVTRSQQQERIAQVLLFDCLMILHAGRIHIHRLFWFADLTLNLQSCSFQRSTLPYTGDEEEAEAGAAAADDADNGSAHSTETRRQLFDANMKSSVIQIVASSDAILSMMRIDVESSFRPRAFALSVLPSEPFTAARSTTTVPQQPIFSPHWPVIGCCQMVASYGLAVGTAAAERNVRRTETHGSSILEGGVDTLHLSSISDNDLRAVESISGIAFAEASLDIQSSVWPVAAWYREQVHACRIAIDARL